MERIVDGLAPAFVEIFLMMIKDFLFLNSKAHLLLDRRSNEVSGGAELQVALLARELAARGKEVTILHGSGKPGEPRVFEGVEAVPCGPFHTGGLLDTLRSIPPVFRNIWMRRPRHVLVLGWTAWLFLLWLARPIFGYRLIFICGLDTEADGSFAAENGIRGRLFDFAMRRSDLIFAMSKAQVRLYERRGISTALYRNLVLTRTEPRTAKKDIDLLWIARCRPIKRPLEFLDLAKALPSAKCLMVCPPEDAALFRRVQTEAASLENLEFREFVPYHEVQALYDRAKIFVNTSISEGFANSFIQAGLGGAAILSLSVDCDGVIAGYRAGLCANGDRVLFIKDARRLLSDSGMLAEMQKGAERFVAENHSNWVNVNAFLAGIDNLRK